MKTLVLNRNIIVSIFAVMLLIYGVQGISYAQEVADPVAEFADASLAETVRRTLRLERGDTVDILRIPKAELVKLTRLDASWRQLMVRHTFETILQFPVLPVLLLIRMIWNASVTRK